MNHINLLIHHFGIFLARLCAEKRIEILFINFPLQHGLQVFITKFAIICFFSICIAFFVKVWSLQLSRRNLNVCLYLLFKVLKYILDWFLISFHILVSFFGCWLKLWLKRGNFIISSKFAMNIVIKHINLNLFSLLC